MALAPNVRLPGQTVVAFAPVHLQAVVTVEMILAPAVLKVMRQTAPPRETVYLATQIAEIA